MTIFFCNALYYYIMTLCLQCIVLLHNDNFVCNALFFVVFFSGGEGGSQVV